MGLLSRSRRRVDHARVALVVALGALVCCSPTAPSDVVSTSMDTVDPSSGWSGCGGTFDTHASPTGAYFVTDFGCSSSPEFTDSSDNCCPSGVVQAASDGLCAAGTTPAGCTDNVGTEASIACERAVNWFSTGGSAYGLGTRLRLTRPDTGTSVVVFVVDNGPACYREQQFGGYALDISYPAILALYGEEEGVTDRATVTAIVVPASTPLGLASAVAPAADAGTGPELGSESGPESGTEPDSAAPGDSGAPLNEASMEVSTEDTGFDGSDDGE